MSGIQPLSDTTGTVETGRKVSEVKFGIGQLISIRLSRTVVKIKMATSATVHYTGQKVSKVKWEPCTHLRRSTVFATGGWDNDVSFLTTFFLVKLSSIQFQLI